MENERIYRQSLKSHVLVWRLFNQLLPLYVDKHTVVNLDGKKPGFLRDVEGEGRCMFMDIAKAFYKLTHFKKHLYGNVRECASASNVLGRAWRTTNFILLTARIDFGRTATISRRTHTSMSEGSMVPHATSRPKMHFFGIFRGYSLYGKTRCQPACCLRVQLQVYLRYAPARPSVAH